MCGDVAKFCFFFEFESDVYLLYMNIKDNFTSTRKFEWALPRNAYHVCGLFFSGKTMMLFIMVPIMPT